MLAGFPLSNVSHITERQSKPVVITFRNFKIDDENTLKNLWCVWWDSDNLTFVRQNHEDGDGCRLAGTNETHSICECTHLNAYYALMMDSSPIVEEWNDFVSII